MIAYKLFNFLHKYIYSICLYVFFKTKASISNTDCTLESIHSDLISWLVFLLDFGEKELLLITISCSALFKKNKHMKTPGILK